MVKYLIFLSIGILFGIFAPEINGVKKVKSILMSVSVLCLLFFMGVGIGKDPELKLKIANFGLNALVISSFSILFSIIVVFIMVRAFRRHQK
ncbi:LysO family transporter [Deferribacteraceae bacterium V6Fe1]|nr:LysO family transporter [Deferribacteraceae bacterium V6Fe1]